ncbi:MULTISPECIES: carboxypeptidase regulatory-like domain-containing protein [unclassified Pseudoalteromonas]|uniref:carboxypeptidase regulatory-like domain-containing protein n=1 Tax=Pseudoalteromonas TaxID=53246 RepID=UPI00110BD1D2|nr:MULTISPECIES: carboxypeptidase regulatory-like domain-containing protein [unclassified Pseudoalteromonas]MBC7008920.1 TonB-dependent receptor [Pseudoalteromonas sp. BZK2]MCF2915821.1 carboxypeptidase regulatory-like domain-containing protein [Pseudoalteromonas sp. Cn5-37]MCH2089333.1 carboxypeptidase regulatory-like domain-containing protein [Pseudoalteromonas sp.]TMP41428.1 TonB-dependent receptor [Pseudoalteromonas sp. S1650]TMP64999.1 TonB-dependent receptor [Pseudoalteromonas sp. S1649]
MKQHASTLAMSYIAKATSNALRAKKTALTGVVMAAALASAPAFANLTGGIKGKVSSPEAQQSLAGITVTAKSNVMPKPRTVVTREDGSYDLPQLKPGTYELTFTDKNGVTQTMTVDVLLEQTSSLNVTMGGANENVEVITVTGSKLFRQGKSALTNSLGEEAINSVPVGQDYRDLLKLVPGVELSANTILGPSAGGSGVDNSYGFDGVNVSMPMFGNLASEPSTHDVAYVTMDRGGAKAVGFNRSGGFSINTVSKSGTDEFHGNVEYKVQPKSFVATPVGEESYELDKSWLTASLGGPLIEDTLYFYTSYYRPEETRSNKDTAYGGVKEYESIRDEYFGKLTWAPTDDILINISQRTSDKEVKGDSIGAYETDSVSVGSKADQDIFTLDGSWILGSATTLSFQYSKFELETGSKPDTELSVVPSLNSQLDVNNLTQMGYFSVPSLRDYDPEEGFTEEQIAIYNAGATGLINTYGYTEDGVLKGGGGVGAYSQYDNINFYRDSFEISLEHEFDWGDTYHTLHFGAKWEESEEQLTRLSNGWGRISYLGGLVDADADTEGFDPADAIYRAHVQQMSLATEDGSTVSGIDSEMRSLNFEINDTIEHGDWTYNIGLLVSQDTWYGQGLKAKSGTVSGYELAPGNKYEMYKTDWSDMLQPRLGATWTYSGEDSVFANFAIYNPEASSLARAASWDRNTRAEIELLLDESGNILSASPRRGSSGKAFQEGMKPRRINEFTLGTTKYVGSDLVLRAHVRHRKGMHFWEDMPNTARLTDYSGVDADGVPQHIADKGLYVDNLDEIRDEIGGSSYVIAEVDGGETKYWEASIEAEYLGENSYINASYVWSHYYGNFDQDNTTTSNDANNFIGSSYYGDGRGRYSWDNRYGTLSGDKPHKVKVYGYYTVPWEANIGAYFVFQSGQAWENWDGTMYGYPTSHVSRYAEPAGSRRTASHWQLDLNYTQDFKFSGDMELQFRADIFNVFNRQTGYNKNPYVLDENYGESRSYYNPRSLQLSVNFKF